MEILVGVVCIFRVLRRFGTTDAGIGNCKFDLSADMFRSHSILKLHRLTAGVVLVEVMVALGLAAMTLAAVAAANSMCFGMVRAQRETIAASQLMNERLEQMRAGGWTQVTSGTALRDQVLAVSSPLLSSLSGVHETITVTTYPAVTPAASPLRVERLADGSLTISSLPPGGLSLRNMLAVRVDLKVEWTSRQNKRARSRETSSVISAGGLLR